MPLPTGAALATFIERCSNITARLSLETMYHEWAGAGAGMHLQLVGAGSSTPARLGARS